MRCANCENLLEPDGLELYQLIPLALQKTTIQFVLFKGRATGIRVERVGGDYLVRCQDQTFGQFLNPEAALKRAAQIHYAWTRHIQVLTVPYDIPCSL